MQYRHIYLTVVASHQLTINPVSLFLNFLAVFSLCVCQLACVPVPVPAGWAQLGLHKVRSSHPHLSTPIIRVHGHSDTYFPSILIALHSLTRHHVRGPSLHVCLVFLTEQKKIMDRRSRSPTVTCVRTYVVPNSIY